MTMTKVDPNTVKAVELIEQAREKLLEFDHVMGDFEATRIEVDRLLRRAELLLAGIEL